MIPAVVDALACPVCGERMSQSGRSLVCVAGHTHDIAKQGYVSLLAGARRATTGDTAEMVAARAAFLAAGHYAPIADAVADAIPEADGVCLDLAGGTGYYLAAVLDRHPALTGLGLDLSPFAARRAARAHERAVAATADAWGTLPVRTGRVAAALNVFGPRNGAELARVLAPGGTLVVVTPTPSHLVELRDVLGLLAIEQEKEARLAEQLALFRPVGRTPVEYVAAMGSADLEHEARMGPSAHHLDEQRLADGIRSLPDPTDVTVSVVVSTWVAPAT